MALGFAAAAQSLLSLSANPLEFFPVATGNHSGFRMIETGDVTGDGISEIAFSINGGRVDLRRFDCGNTLGYISGYPWSHAGAATFIDLNGDAAVDAVVGVNGQPHLTKFINNGNGGFSSAGHITATGNVGGRGSIHAFDSDGDGDQDLVGSDFAGTPFLLTNDGHGNFTLEANAGFQGWGSDTYDIVTEDMDGDGDLDVLFGYYNWHPSNVRPSLYRNDGNNVFTGVWPTNSPYTWYMYRMSVGDVDGNGLNDIYVGGSRWGGTFLPDEAILYLNQGNFNFTEVNISAQLPDMQRYYIGKLADFDNDGISEFATTLAMPAGHVYHTAQNFYGYPAIFKWNNANANFDLEWAHDPWQQVEVNGTPIWLLTAGFGVEAADFDGDGRVDLLSQGGQGFIFLNGHDINDCGQSASQDTDGDGLTDDEELTLGTDPNAADSDGDGLTDGDEVLNLGTDPLAADSDGEGLTDGDEVLTYGTDPLAVDSDGDGLDDATEILLGTDPNNGDTDGDGVGDSADAFPNDPNEWADTDGDGVGDNGDAFPNDPTETTDSDGDGVGDNSDLFPNSDLSPTIIVDGCDTGVANAYLADGATVNDLIQSYLGTSTTHGQFVKLVSHLANDLKKAGLISGKEKGKITKCAAQSNSLPGSSSSSGSSASGSSEGSGGSDANVGSGSGSSDSGASGSAAGNKGKGKKK